MATPILHIWSTIQAGGDMEIQFSPALRFAAFCHCRAMAVRFLCDNVAIFGTPVVPEV